MIEGLKLPEVLRLPHQSTCTTINNFKNKTFAVDCELLQWVMLGHWVKEKAQIQCFESSPGACRASVNKGDSYGRNVGLVDSLVNFQWYLAAHIHKDFVNVMDHTAEGIRRSQDLYRVNSDFLVHLTNQWFANVFQGLPSKEGVFVDGVWYSLMGPRAVAEALRATGLGLLEVLGDRQRTRELEAAFKEEKDDRKDTEDMMAKVRNSADKGKHKTSVSFLVDQAGDSPKKRDGREIDYGSGPVTVKKEKKKLKIDLGSGPSSGGVNPPAGQSLPPPLCCKHMAGLLKVALLGGVGVETCDRAGGTCRFSHVALKEIKHGEAIKATLALSNACFRTRLLAVVKAQVKRFKT
jgi:hypothetical protein